MPQHSAAALQPRRLLPPAAADVPYSQPEVLRCLQHARTLARHPAQRRDEVSRGFVHRKLSAAVCVPQADGGVACARAEQPLVGRERQRRNVQLMPFKRANRLRLATRPLADRQVSASSVSAASARPVGSSVDTTPVPFPALHLRSARLLRSAPLYCTSWQWWATDAPPRPVASHRAHSSHPHCCLPRPRTLRII